MRNYLFIAFCMIATLAEAQTFDIEASGFKCGTNISAPNNDGGIVSFSISDRGAIPFCQSAIKQTRSKELVNEDISRAPYFTVRYALPIPSANTPTEQGEMAGLDKGVYNHLHSAGMDIMPNGDVLAIYFSTPLGKSEADTSTTFVQARLRYGAVEWDMPELFFDTHNANDQSALVWRDGDKVWFFGGGRDISDWVPFRYCTTIDNGATWTYNVPKLSQPATEYTAQPISNAFRAADGSIYMASDGKSSTSFLWQSKDDSQTWHQMAGRTSGRHSTIVPLDEKGTLLSIGGKNASIDGWTPQNISHDWGETWEEATKAPFPPLGTAQRPCMIRLKSGNLLLVTDSYMHKKKIAPPAGWQNGNDCVVALSTDNGKTWKIKSLPIALPQHHRVEHPSLGYVTLRQAENGAIHILTTTNFPGLDIEFNEAWVNEAEEFKSSRVQEGSRVQGVSRKSFSEYYPDGKVRIQWSANVYEDETYLLDGKEISYYSNGKKEHEVNYTEGRKNGKETFWNPDGTIRWTWKRDIKTNRATWTQYHDNGKKKVESSWNLKPSPRDLPQQSFYGYFAEGPARHYDKNGKLISEYIFHNGVCGETTDATSAGILNEGQ